MATTIYSFQADLTQLLKLNGELERANINLNKLKANTLAYSAQAKKVSTMGTTMKKNTVALRGANVQAQALNRTGGRMVAIFRSASIAIVSAFAFRAILGGMRGIITSFSNFEQQMAAVKAISGATDKEFKKLNDSALELGRTTVFTAKQVGELQEEYARLGFTADEIVAAQQGTISLAAATGESLKSSAETSGAVLRAFGLDARDTGNIVDVMGASFTSSALNLNRFRESMKFVAPVARAAGFTLEETSAMLAKLADNGLHGSIAGNALKNIMLRLGDANSKLNKKLGKTVQGLPQFIDALKGMKDESFGLTEAVDLLDKRSAPAFLALMNNVGGLNEQLDLLNNAEGAVSRMAQIRLDTLEGDFTLLKSATEGLGVAIGDVFDNSLRQSITSLTEWVQGLASSEKFLNGLATTFAMATGVVQALLIKFALLKLSTLSLTLNFKGLVKGVRLLMVSMRGLATGTMTASTAMKGFRAALASTGVGLLVVGIGALVGWLMKLKGETSEVVHQMNQMHTSFEKDLKKVTELNVENTERVDLLRKLNQDYPELIGNIDLETASNKDLLEILTVINDTRTERTLIADKQALIDKIFEEAEMEALVHRRLLLKNQSMQESGKLSEFQLYNFKQSAIAIQNNIDKIMNKAKVEEAAHLKDIKIFLASIKRKQQANGTWRELETAEEQKHRTKLSNMYDKDLEAFRAIASKLETAKDGQTAKEQNRLTKLAKAKQEHEIAKVQAEMEGIEKTLKFHEIYKRVGVGTSKQINATSKEFLKFTENMSKSQIKDMKKAEGLNLLGIQIQEMRKKLVKLNGALIKSGKAAGQSAIDVHKLQTTKNRIKELVALRIQSITDIQKKERDAVEEGFEKQTRKYTKEKLLIKANISSIAGYILGNAKNQDALNKDFIEKNKNKYDVLKNQDAAGWTKLNDETQVGIDARIKALDDMYKEEIAKAHTNKEVIDEITKAKAHAIAVMENGQNMRRLSAEKASLKTRMSQLDTGFESIFRSNKEFKTELREDAALELQYVQDQMDLGIITEEEGAAKKLAINKTLSDELNAMEDQRLSKIKETYAAIAGAIMDVSANMAAVKIQGIEDDAEREKGIEQDKFDRKLQIAEKAGKNTEGMQKKHDIKMKALEEQKAADIRAVKKKQFMLQKANDITMAIINGAIAITKVTAQTGIGAIAAAPLTSALVAMQIAAIASRQFVGEEGGITPSKTSDGSLQKVSKYADGGMIQSPPEIKFADGGTVPPEIKFADGGMVQGPSHAKGGVKFAAGGKVVELEGGEAVINKRSTAMYRPQLSAMNVAGGGKKFAQGGMTPGMRTTMDGAKDNWTANDIAGLITNSINSQQVFVTEADISSSQSTVDIIEGTATIF